MKYIILISQILLIVFLSSCKKESHSLPVVETSPVTDTSWYYAICGGVVLNEGGSPVTQRGVCISTSNPPMVVKGDNSNYTVDSSGPGPFTSKIYFRGTNNSLRSATRYIRAYAMNSYGTAYGEVQICFPKYSPPEIPIINLSGLTSSTAKINVELPINFNNPTQALSELDLCYSSNPEPSINENHVSILNLNQYTINNLLPNTTYYVRCYAKNSGGYVYSSEISFTTWEGEITDKSGNIYQIKTIGDHIWTVNNLQTTKFNDGSNIQLIQDNLLWASTSSSAYCTYTDYGKLYNYYAVMDNRNLCPSGWHVPTDNDWKSLEISLGMNTDQVNATGLRGTLEGGKLKYVNKSIYEGWNFPNVGATNSSGFSAFGAGYRNTEGIFDNENISANFWTITEFDAISAWSRSLGLSHAQIIRLNINKGYGFSVRCIKDNTPDN
jgi:uncharacterized protein (TIGR02145 family)